MLTREERREILAHRTDLITAAITEAVARAIEQHRRLGFPIVIWRDGRVVEVPPEEIPPYTPPERR